MFFLNLLPCKSLFKQVGYGATKDWPVECLKKQNKKTPIWNIPQVNRFISNSGCVMIVQERDIITRLSHSQVWMGHFVKHMIV